MNHALLSLILNIILLKVVLQPSIVHSNLTFLTQATKLFSNALIPQPFHLLQLINSVELQLKIVRIRLIQDGRDILKDLLKWRKIGGASGCMCWFIRTTGIKGAQLDMQFHSELKSSYRAHHENLCCKQTIQRGSHA